MKISKNTPLEFEIDKLTNSIENTSTGEVFDTAVVRLSEKDLRLIIKSDWQFDWSKEIKDKTKEVYKLTTVYNLNIIRRHCMPPTFEDSECLLKLMRRWN
jgi:hypothetical protein